MTLAADSKARKNTPMATGCLDYFPLALAAISRLSKAGNDKHNPGQPLHWSRDKSTDHADCILRHMADRGLIDGETGELHDVAIAWRALAMLQLAEEKRLEKGTSDADGWILSNGNTPKLPITARVMVHTTTERREFGPYDPATVAWHVVDRYKVVA